MLISVWERVNGKNSFHPLHLAVLAFGLHQVKLKTLICNIKKIDNVVIYGCFVCLSVIAMRLHSQACQRFLMQFV